MNIKLRIKELRQNSNLTQRQIAEILSCDQSLYSKYERSLRDIPLSLVIKLANYYGVSLDYIVGLEHPDRNVSEK